MKKTYRVCKNYEFTSIIQKRNYIKCASFVCYYKSKKEPHARVGISVGKKLGNAVVRNKIKRQVRSMIDSIYTFTEEYDTIIIVRPVYLKHTYRENMNELQKIKEKLDKKRMG